MIRIPEFHSRDPGSIPEVAYFFFTRRNVIFLKLLLKESFAMLIIKYENNKTAKDTNITTINLYDFKIYECILCTANVTNIVKLPKCIDIVAWSSGLKQRSPERIARVRISTATFFSPISWIFRQRT